LMREALSVHKKRNHITEFFFSPSSQSCCHCTSTYPLNNNDWLTIWHHLFPINPAMKCYYWSCLIQSCMM
jgi:hypothetical protein